MLKNEHQLRPGEGTTHKTMSTTPPAPLDAEVRTNGGLEEKHTPEQRWGSKKEKIGFTAHGHKRPNLGEKKGTKRPLNLGGPTPTLPQS